MKRLRFTIRELILVVVVIAIGLAAIRSGSAPWAGAMTSITFFVMIASTLGVALGRAMRRVFWSGFALLGWSYLLLTHVPWLTVAIGSRMLAPTLFAYIAELLHGEAKAGGGGGLQSAPVHAMKTWALAGGFGGGTVSYEHLTNSVQIGIAMEALLWAFLGGRVACYFASRREQERRSANHSSQVDEPGRQFIAAAPGESTPP
jgi:hypothetical protein